MIEIRRAITPADMEAARALLRQYGTIPGVGECVSGFAAEIEGLPGRYAQPEGVLLVACLDGRAAGCGALRRIGPGVCEMKRLYVEPPARGSGLGRALALALIEAGRELGYGGMRLDTLPFMQSAIAVYRSLGFRQIERYDANSPPDALYFELALGPRSPRTDSFQTQVIESPQPSGRCGETRQNHQQSGCSSVI